MTTDKHDDGAMSEDSGHPPRWVYAKTPRREIDFETLDMRWLARHSEPETRLSRFFEAVTDYLDRRKLRKHKAQAQVNATVDQEPKPIAWPTDDEIAQIAKEVAERRATDETVRQELEQCSDADLEVIEAPRFMFLRYSDDQGFRARVTLRQRVAQELLDERAQAAGAYEPDLPHPAGRPRRWWQAP